MSIFMYSRGIDPVIQEKIDEVFPNRLAVGSRVLTKQGAGTIVDIEYSYVIDFYMRYGVELDNSPFSFNPAFYTVKEVTLIPDEIDPDVYQPGNFIQPS